jgi:hypothetical protein
MVLPPHDQSSVETQANAVTPLECGRYGYGVGIIKTNDLQNASRNEISPRDRIFPNLTKKVRHEEKESITNEAEGNTNGAEAEPNDGSI